MRQHQTEKIQEFNGIPTSKKPRFALIPPKALEAMADRFALGEEKYKGKAWNAMNSQACLEERDWIIARAEHVIHHAYQFIGKYTGQIQDDGDDDAAAIMWGGACLSEAKRVSQPKD